MTLYDLVYATAIAATAPLWLVVPRLRRKVIDALRDRRGIVPIAAGLRPAVLIHAVSMGEINATTALVQLLGDTVPDARFIISTTSRTGENRARELYEKNPSVTRVRFPFDFSKSVKKLLANQRPVVVVLMELEVWPNFMRECERRGIPVILVNGRLSAHSFRRYRLGGPLTRPMFRRLKVACVQEEAYARRFEEIGVPPARIRITGTMKFDTAQVIDRIPGADMIALSVGLGATADKIWVCGSTGPGEEQLILAAYKELRIKFPGLRLAIIPRHPERFDDVAKLIQSHGLPLVRRSQVKAAAHASPAPSVSPSLRLSLSPSPDPSAVVLGDTMGELRKFYSIADIVFVGRTLVDLGPKQHGSDMIEPAALAKPVIVGRFTGNFTEVMNRFREAGAIREVNNGEQLRDAVADLLLAPIAAAEIGSRAQHVVRKNQGATLRHVEVILEHFPIASRVAVKDPLADSKEEEEEEEDDEIVPGQEPAND
jgi:3-deoxy-D-manno-octulosonic-acid transferase